MAEPGQTPTSRQGALPPPASALPELGERLEVLGRLGQGGFAIVERARDRSTGREVALKLLQTPRGAGLERLTRFYREGEVAARLEHPGIVRVHAAGTFHGQPCLVYELVEGARSLAEVLPELPLLRRLEALRDVARALGWAHARGVVHRDVKPENVLVDAQGRVRLTDFGLAAVGDLERLTRTGAVIGTPYYMSPEQLTSSREHVGPPSDVWALGVMLYQALTDCLPFSAQSLTALAVEVLADSFAPPRRLRREVSSELEAVCLTALRSEPGERYPDADSFAADLERVLAGERPMARPRRRLSVRRLALGLALALPAAAGAWHLAAPPAAAPQATPVATGPAPAPLARTPGQELDELAGVSDPWARGEAARGWLDRNPAHPRLPEARQMVAAAGGEVPLRRLAWGPAGRARSAVFLEGDAFLSFANEPVLRAGQADTGRALPPWPGHQGAAALPHPEGGFLLGAGGALHWLVPRGELLLLRRVIRAGGHAVSLALARRRGLVAAAIGDAAVVFRLADGVQVAAFPLGHEATCVGFSPDERWLVAGSVTAAEADLEAGELLAWTVDDWQPAWRQQVMGGVYCLTFTPEGGTLVVGSRGCLVLLVDPGSGEGRSLEGRGVKRARLGQVAHDRPVKGLAVTPDGRRLFSLASAVDKPGNELGVWDLPAGEMSRDMLRFDEGLHACSLALDPSGRRLLIGSEEGVVLVWLAPP